MVGLAAMRRLLRTAVVFGVATAACGDSGANGTSGSAGGAFAGGSAGASSGNAGSSSQGGANPGGSGGQGGAAGSTSSDDASVAGDGSGDGQAGSGGQGGSGGEGGRDAQAESGSGDAPAGKTYADYANDALKALHANYYASGKWKAYPAATAKNHDWGDDSLTYDLYFHWLLTKDATILPELEALPSSMNTPPAPS